MNALADNARVAHGDIDDFADCCVDQAWFCDRNFVTRQVAVDNLQWLAERWLLIDEFGQTEIQRIMAAAFAPVPKPIDLPDDYAAMLVKMWEMSDPRDQWKHTGRLPPDPVLHPPFPLPRAYETATSTIDAFRLVTRMGGAGGLRTWLADHPRDAEFLLLTFEKKHAVA